jgi:hypothetical protein
MRSKPRPAFPDLGPPPPPMATAAPASGRAGHRRPRSPCRAATPPGSDGASHAGRRKRTDAGKGPPRDPCQAREGDSHRRRHHAGFAWRLSPAAAARRGGEDGLRGRGGESRPCRRGGDAERSRHLIFSLDLKCELTTELKCEQRCKGVLVHM